MALAQTAGIDFNEILRQVAREKDIDLERWLSALEDAMASAAKKQHRIKEPVRAHLDRETGRFDAFIVRKVVETVEDPLAEWTVAEARDHKPDAEVGDEIHLPLSTAGLGRIAAQNAKRVLYQRVREAERENTAMSRTPAPAREEEVDLTAAPGIDAAADQNREIEAVAVQRSEIVAQKHSGKRLSPSEEERLESLTSRLRELLPPVSVGELEVLLTMAQEAEHIRRRARERRQRLELG